MVCAITIAFYAFNFDMIKAKINAEFCFTSQNTLTFYKSNLKENLIRCIGPLRQYSKCAYAQPFLAIKKNFHHTSYG